ncbi:MAG: M48 family metallopeptidase [Deltaproteobacteria bacterium]|nr:M48 family metallopeptidase [Deltaproteobacteria bacterium]
MACRLVAAMFIFISLVSCAQVPLTGRKGLHLLPRAQLYSMGLQQYSEVIKEAKISRNRQKVRLVKSVGERIAKAAEKFMKESGMEDRLEDYQWEFNLIEDDKTNNAWCMPGGKVAVYTGILPVTKDETGLAVVIGHEVAHAIADHGNERMSQSLIVSMGGIALSVALSEQPEKTRELFLSAFGAAAGIGFLLPYSRVHESEADRIGLMLMARAGYDPREAIPFWERMNEKAGPNPPQFLSTHPVPKTRISEIRSFIPEAMPYYEKYKKKT